MSAQSCPAELLQMVKDLLYLGPQREVKSHQLFTVNILLLLLLAKLLAFLLSWMLHWLLRVWKFSLVQYCQTMFSLSHPRWCTEFLKKYSLLHRHFTLSLPSLSRPVQCGLAEWVTGRLYAFLRIVTVPNNLKRAVVRPLIQKSSLHQSDVNDLQPVSNSPFLGKILKQYSKFSWIRLAF